MKRMTFCTLSGMLLLPALACAASLQEQISAVDNVMSQQSAAEAEAKAKEQKRIEAQRAAESLARAKEQGRAEALYASQRIEREKQQKIQNAAQEQAKLRKQAREEKIQDLQLEEMSLDLEAKRAKAKRINDYVDADLKKQAAATDVVQSEADANRNVSSGIGDNLKSTGKAAETKAKKWF